MGELFLAISILVIAAALFWIVKKNGVGQSWLNGIEAVIIFVGALLLGSWVILALPFGLTESAVLYLAAVVGTGFFWIGRKK